MYRNSFLDFQLYWSSPSVPNLDDSCSPMNVIPIISYDDKDVIPFEPDYDSFTSPSHLSDFGFKSSDLYGDNTPLTDICALENKDLMGQLYSRDAFDALISPDYPVYKSRDRQSYSTQFRIRRGFQSYCTGQRKDKQEISTSNGCCSFLEFARDTNLQAIIPPQIMDILVQTFVDYNASVQYSSNRDLSEVNQLTETRDQGFCGKRKYTESSAEDFCNSSKRRRIEIPIDNESINSVDTPINNGSHVMNSCSYNIDDSYQNNAEISENLHEKAILRNLNVSGINTIEPSQTTIISYDKPTSQEEKHPLRKVSSSIQEKASKSILDKKAVKITFRPARKTNADYVESDQFPEHLLSAPYKYLMKITYKDTASRPIPEAFLMDEYGEHFHGKFSVSLVKSLTGKDHNGYSQTFMVQMRATSFETKSQFCISIPSLNYTSRLFSIKARYGKGEVVSWPTLSEST